MNSKNRIQNLRVLLLFITIISSFSIFKNVKAEETQKVIVNRDNFTEYFKPSGSAIGNYNEDSGEQFITNGSNQSGNVYFDGSIDLRYDFELTGAINFGESTSVKDGRYIGVADGIGFVFYKGIRKQSGGSGGDLGIYGVTNAFGWKFDTWYNGPQTKVNGQNDVGLTSAISTDKSGDTVESGDPYGAFVTTDSKGYGSIDGLSVNKITKSKIIDGKYHNISFKYSALTNTITVTLSVDEEETVSFSKSIIYDNSNPLYYFTISAATGALPTKHGFKFEKLEYSASQRAIINYVDRTTGDSILTDNVIGNSGEKIKYSTATRIAEFIEKKYALYSDGFSTASVSDKIFDSDDKIDQEFKVLLDHTFSDKGNDTKEVTREINYNYSTGGVASPKVTQTLEFTRTSKEDLVLQSMVYGNWSPTSSAFNSVASPTISGYTADITEIAELLGVTGNDNNIKKAIIYSPNDQALNFDANSGKTDQTSIVKPTDTKIDLTELKGATRAGYAFNGWYDAPTDGSKLDTTNSKFPMPAGGKTYYAQWRVNQESATVSYIDDTTNTTITTDNLSGDYGTTDAYRTQEMIDRYKNDGYEFVSDNYPSEGVLYNKAGIVQTFEVHLKHRTVIETEKTTISQIIHYVYSDGTKASDDYIKSLNFSREVETDLVTSNKTYTDWQPKTGTSFSSVKSPDIIGYTPDIKEISAVDNITEGSTNTETTVTYTANDESAKVTYIDDTTGKTLSVSELSGKFGTRDSYKTKASIKTYVDAGYELVSDNYPIDGVTYDKAGILQEFEVHLKHVTSNKTETKTITRTIHYNYSDGSTASKDHISTLSFIRVETTDVATGTVSYGDWQSVEGTTTFDAVVSPTITGYSADSPIMKEVSNISSESKDINQTVTYSLNTETASVTYIDDTTGNILRTDELSGLYGSTDTYKTSDKIDSYLAKGYVKVSDDYPSTGVVYNESGVKKTYTVHLKHGIPNSVETRTISQVIHYQYSDGTKAFEDYKAKLTFKSTVTTDLVTGVKIYGDWQAVDGTTFKEVPSPSIEGYTPSAKNIPAIDNITGSSNDIDLTIVYTKEIDNPTTPGVTTGGGTLPKTGEDTTSVYAILGMFVLGIGSYLSIHKKRKSKKQPR